MGRTKILQKMLLFLLGLLIFTEGNAMPFQISSDAFKNGAMIPTKFSCHGSDVSPVLSWSDAPKATKSFVLIMDDPDAPMGVWVHWILFNIPANITKLEENISQLPTGAVIGSNSWHRQSYNGPCPPSGTHRYFFKLYALDSILNLPAGSNKEAVEKAMHGHVLAIAELMGKYGS